MCGGVYLQVGGGAVVVVGVGGVAGVAGVAGVVRRGPAARVPDGGALQEHLLAVAEGVAALAAARARGVEVVVVARLHARHALYSCIFYVYYNLHLLLYYAEAKRKGMIMIPHARYGHSIEMYVNNRQ